MLDTKHAVAAGTLIAAFVRIVHRTDIITTSTNMSPTFTQTQHYESLCALACLQNLQMLPCLQCVYYLC
jgi:hypothetical protein